MYKNDPLPPLEGGGGIVSSWLEKIKWGRREGKMEEGKGKGKKGSGRENGRKGKKGRREKEWVKGGKT